MLINTICYDCRKVYAYELKGKCPGCKSGNTKHFVELGDIREAVQELKNDIVDYANEELGGEIWESPELNKVWQLIEDKFGFDSESMEKAGLIKKQEKKE